MRNQKKCYLTQFWNFPFWVLASDRRIIGSEVGSKIRLRSSDLEIRIWSEIRVISKKLDPNPRIRIRKIHIWIRIRGSEIREIIFWIRIRDPDPTYSRITDPSLGSCDPSDLTDLGSWPRILWSVGSYRIWIRWIRGYLFFYLFIAIQFNGTGTKY